MTKAGQRKGMAIGITVVVIVAIVIAGGMAVLLQTPNGCGQLTGLVDASTIRHTVVIEITGNDTESKAEASKFVDAALQASSKGKADVTQEVTLAFVKNGKKLEPTESCLKSPLVLAPSADDVANYRDPETDDATKEQFQTDLESSRTNQIQWVSDAVSRQIGSIDFANEKSASLRWSPLPVWTRAASGSGNTPAGWVSILTPAVSTESDCLESAKVQIDGMEDAVGRCIEFQQLPVLSADHTAVSIASSVLTTEPNARAAAALRDALCKKATTDGCSVTLPAG